MKSEALLVRRTPAPIDAKYPYVLCPSDDAGAEIIGTFPDDQNIALRLHNKRSLPQHRLFWGILTHVAESSKFETAERLLVALKIRSGRYDLCVLPSGKAVPVPHSISFVAMPQDDFQMFMDQSVQLICSEVIPGTNSDDLIREVESMLHTRDSGVRQNRPQEEKDGTPGPSGGATPRSLAVSIRAGARQGTSDWAGTAEDMIAVINAITDPADAAPNGRFKQENRQPLELMRTNDRNAWSTVEHRLGDRARQLRDDADRWSFL